MFPKNQTLSIILVGSGSPPPRTRNGLIRHPSRGKSGEEKGKLEENVRRKIINNGDGNQLINEANPEESRNKNSNVCCVNLFLFLCNVWYLRYRYFLFCVSMCSCKCVCAYVRVRVTCVRVSVCVRKRGTHERGETPQNAKRREGKRPERSTGPHAVH